MRRDIPHWMGHPIGDGSECWWIQRRANAGGLNGERIQRPVNAGEFNGERVLADTTAPQESPEPGLSESPGIKQIGAEMSPEKYFSAQAVPGVLTPKGVSGTSLKFFGPACGGRDVPHVGWTTDVGWTTGGMSHQIWDRPHPVGHPASWDPI
ncbi:hypothetical protein B0H12DRAFT_1081713 [Mycena haematopus]|nr:hypothetical protein B0H12DRAFT_1081713 [Mycena haematopus]